MNKVLVIGANGFIGSNLCHKLSAIKNIKLIASTRRDEYSLYSPKITLDLSDTSAIPLIAELSPDIIVNCAGPSSVRESEINGFLGYNKGPLCVLNLAESCRQIASQKEIKLIHLSSAAVYGDSNEFNLTKKYDPKSIYGKNKLIAEKILDCYSEIYDFNISFCRIFSAYGPGLKKQIIFDFLERIRLDQPLLLHGSGTESRDFIYIDDITNAICNLVIGKESHKFLDLGSGTSVTILNLVSCILSILPPSLKKSSHKVSFDGEISSHSPEFMCATIPEEFPPLILTPLQTGLQETLKWYLEFMNISLA